MLEHLQRRYGWQARRDWLVFLPSVVPGLNVACAAFSAPGEAVMTVTPVYPPFLEAPPARGRRLITVPATLEDGRWRLPLHEMEAALTPDTQGAAVLPPAQPARACVERA